MQHLIVFVLLLDNALVYAANQTEDLIKSFGWEQVDHLPYSPYLAPSDFCSFLNLKKHLLVNEKYVKTIVLLWMSRRMKHFFEEVLQKLVVRYDKCLNINEIILKKKK